MRSGIHAHSSTVKALRILPLLAISVSCLAADIRSETEFKKFVDSKNYEDDVTAYTRELSAHPGDAALLARLGQLHYVFGKYSDAAAALEGALLIEPTHAVAHNYLGCVLVLRGELRAAREHMEVAIKADPGNPDLYISPATIQVTSKPPNRPAARDAYQHALSLGGDADPILGTNVEPPRSTPGEILQFRLVIKLSLVTRGESNIDH